MLRTGKITWRGIFLNSVTEKGGSKPCKFRSVQTRERSAGYEKMTIEKNSVSLGQIPW